MADSPNLVLPYIEAAQAQKHVTHNEALRTLDCVVQLAVLDRDLATPPASPADGARYIVAASPTGAWAGQSGKVAAYQDGAWSFHTPREGWLAWVADENVALAYDGAAWVALGITSINPTPLVGVNATADATNRLSVNAPATLLNHEGAGHQLKINKAAAANTASLLFQDAFSGRAEFGLTGDDDFHVKVSSDGAIFKEAIVVDRSSGAVTLPNTPVAGDVLLARGSVSGQAFTAIALPIGYDEINVSITDWLPSVVSQMWLQVSIDGGATWLDTGYHWCWRYFTTAGNSATINGTALGYVQVSGSQFAPTGSVAALFRFPSYSKPGPKRVRYDTIYGGAAEPFYVVDGFGYCISAAAAPITHFRVYPGSGDAGQTQSFSYVVHGRTSGGSTPLVFPPLQRVECTLRNTGAGWFILNDATHQPVGVSGLTQTATGLVLAFDFVPTKVCSFIVAPDEAYAVEDKLICGASVGTTQATIQIATPTSTGPVDPATLTRAGGNLWVSGAFYR